MLAYLIFFWFDAISTGKRNLSAETYITKPIQTLITNKITNKNEKLKRKHVLILNGQNDTFVYPKINEPLIQNLQKIHVSKEGIDWKVYLVPGIDHDWSSQMVEASDGWTYQWMIKNTIESNL